MMKAKNLIEAFVLLLGAASCAKNQETPAAEPVGPMDPVILTASIADETKATLDDSAAGTFAFSSADVIKVYNGTGIYESTGVTFSGGNTYFTMEEGFKNEGSGFAAFPAGIVTDITSDGVSFTLPDTYTYAEVGGDGASAAMVPCPMVASFAAGNDLEFKQAGAVVRFRITECVAGSLTFTFTSKVTGSVTLTGVPTGDGGGILAANLSDAGYSITVTGVPTVTTGNYIYITLPVPTGTDPLNVGIWNHNTFIDKVATLRNATPISLDRACGYKRGASLTEVSDAAKFDGKILAGDLYYLGSNNFGVLKDPFEVVRLYKVDNTTSGHTDTDIEKCFFNWDFLNDNSFKFKIGDNNYRVPSSGESGDWAGIVGTNRGAAKVNGSNAHYAYLTVTGLDGLDGYREESKKLNITTLGGLLLFPDNAIIAVPSVSKLVTFDGNDGAQGVQNNNTVSVTGLTYLLNQGCSFLPTAGYWNSSDWTHLYWERDWYGINEVASYWSDSSYSSSHAYALIILRNHKTNNPANLIDPEAHDQKSNIYYPVRLILVPPTT
jgi:hypothetical protein